MDVKVINLFSYFLHHCDKIDLFFSDQYLYSWFVQIYTVTLITDAQCFVIPPIWKDITKKNVDCLTRSARYYIYYIHLNTHALIPSLVFSSLSVLYVMLLSWITQWTRPIFRSDSYSFYLQGTFSISCFTWYYTYSADVSFFCILNEIVG